ncbi:hypothetical protein OW763_01335 [Clostridium aestuarii]|uniref:Uncharacterized protein n=1 Tax=Clostridium aestuarii TaxID=338193 RepID=A0ABT4CYG4_9CLOT|nr:hypothetical protein [Clostridium aestuarii]MCY6482995.1 hypothetical protein [Clostridium aestuarii]
MIYRREANFPYPVLTPNSNSYNNSTFTIEVELNENNYNYRFDIDFRLKCEFLNNLIDNNEAELILIIQSKDNKFYKLSKDKRFINIPKSRISLSKRTAIQLLIKSKKTMNFDSNNELILFYNRFKKDISVPKNSVLGFSNVAIFEGSLKQPFDLFEKKIDSRLKSDIKIELGIETIIINYKNKDLQFQGMNKSNTLNNHYVYMGLQKALYKFLEENSGEDEVLYINEMEVPSNGLDFKLYNLLKSKIVDEISMENIDEVIYKITDRILEKHALAIKELCINEN